MAPILERPLAVKLSIGPLALVLPLAMAASFHTAALPGLAGGLMLTTAGVLLRRREVGALASAADEQRSGAAERFMDEPSPAAG